MFSNGESLSFEFLLAPNVYWPLCQCEISSAYYINGHIKANKNSVFALSCVKQSKRIKSTKRLEKKVTAPTQNSSWCKLSFHRYKGLQNQ